MDNHTLRRWLIVTAVLLAALLAADPATAETCVREPVTGNWYCTALL